MGEGLGAYEELQARCEAAEKAVLAAQQHFQAVTAGLSSGADGQEETLAGQKIGMCTYIHASNNVQALVGVGELNARYM